jgi:hypothetical protein
MNTPSTAITPFWQRLGEIFLYPSRPASLITLIVLSLVKVLTLLPSTVGSLLIGLLALAALYKFCFEVLRASANGRLEPPEGVLDMRESIGWGAIGMQLLLFLICFGSFVLGGFILGFAVTGLVLLALPGVWMSYAMDGSFSHALNPSTWIEIMTRIPAGYFSAYGLMIVMAFCEFNAKSLLADLLPNVIGVPLLFFVSGYALVACFHLMGYVIYQYQDMLGYEPEVVASLKRPDDLDQEILDDAATLVHEGEAGMAAEMLRGHIAERGGSEAVHQQYRKLLRLANDNTALIRHGYEFLAVLMAQDKDKAAVELLRDCFEVDPGFAPKEAEWVTRLAAKAAQVGQTPVALRLLQGFAKRFPKSPDIPGNYLLAATLLSERMGKDAEAKALLTQIKAVFPQHELMPRIDAMLEMLSKLSGKAASPT